MIGVLGGSYGFMVLWFYGVMVLWCYGFMVLWFYGVMVLWCAVRHKVIDQPPT